MPIAVNFFVGGGTSGAFKKGFRVLWIINLGTLCVCMCLNECFSCKTFMLTKEATLPIL